MLYRTTPAASASASIAPPAAAFLSRAQKYPGGGNKIIPHTGTSYSNQCGMVVRPLIVGSFVHKSSSSIPFPSNHTRTADLEAEAVNQFDALQLFLLCCCMRGKEKKREGERKNKKVSGCAFFFWLCDQGTGSSSYCTPAYYCTRTVHVRQLRRVRCQEEGGGSGIDACCKTLHYQLLLIFFHLCNALLLFVSRAVHAKHPRKSHRPRTFDFGFQFRYGKSKCQWMYCIVPCYLFFRSCTRRPVITRSRTASECQGGEAWRNHRDRMATYLKRVLLVL